VDDAVAAYLSTGALPKRVAGDQADKKCPPIPQPDPAGQPGTGKPAGKRAGLPVSATRLAVRHLITGR
jgi:hypothetical protein